MKSYRDYIHSSISMIDGDGLSKCLELIKDRKIDVIIETGTFEGRGSTRTVGNFFKKSPPKIFYTIEINHDSYSKAKNNLADLPFITCLYGCSVSLQNALDFIRSDDAIINHQKYPDIYIDDVDDPVKFYSKEVEGYLSGKRRGLRQFFSFRPTPQQDLVKELVAKHTKDTILFILDSAGGMGWLEFMTVYKEMGKRGYYVLLDDTHHIKHFRSAQFIKNNPKEFELIGENRDHGWLLCHKKDSL